MKRLNWLNLLLALMLIFAGVCSADAAKKKVKGKGKAKVAAPVVTKGATHTYGDFLTTQELTIKKGESKISVEYPVAGNQKLVEAIRRDIVADVTQDYEMGENTANSFSLDEPEIILKEAIKKYSRRCSFGQDCSSVDMDITVCYQKGDLITVKTSGEFYFGGSHGSALLGGTTYLTSDGTRFTATMLPPFNRLEKLITTRIMEEYNLSAEEMEYDVNISDYPGQGIYVNENGVNFQYGQYEIGPYSMGLPNAVIPVSTLRNYCQGEALKFLK